MKFRFKKTKNKHSKTKTSWISPVKISPMRSRSHLQRSHNSTALLRKWQVWQVRGGPASAQRTGWHLWEAFLPEGNREICERENALVKGRETTSLQRVRLWSGRKVTCTDHSSCGEDTSTVKIPPQGFALALNSNVTAKQPLCKAAGLVQEAQRFCGRAGSVTDN